MRFRASRFAIAISLCAVSSVAAVAIAQTLPVSPRVGKLISAPAETTTDVKYDIAVQLQAPVECTAGQACPVSVSLENQFAFDAEGPFYVSLTSTTKGGLKFINPSTWQCDGNKEFSTCKSPNQILTQNTPSRFSAQLAIPAETAAGEASVCAAITWMGSATDGIEQKARIKILQSALKSAQVYSDDIDGNVTPNLNLAVYSFMQKYGLTAEALQTGSQLAQALFGANATVAKDQSLINDMSCTKVNIKAMIASAPAVVGGSFEAISPNSKTTPNLPSADFSQATAAAAAVSGGLDALQPNFGAPPKPVAVTKAPEPAKAAAPVVATKAPEPAKAAAPVAVTKAPEPAKAAAPVAVTKVPEPAKATAPVAVTKAPEPAKVTKPSSSKHKEKAAPSAPKPFFFFDPRKFGEGYTAPDPKKATANPAQAKPFFFFDPRNLQTPSEDMKPKTKKKASYNHSVIANAFHETGELDRYMPSITLAEHYVRSEGLQQYASNSRFTFSQPAVNTVSVYDIKLEGEPKDMRVIQFDALPNETTEPQTGSPARIIRGNQKPMPQFLTPGEDFTTLYVQGSSPSSSFRVIIPTANGALGAGGVNTNLPVDANSLPGLKNPLFTTPQRNSPYIIKVQ